MKISTVREFRDNATGLLRSKDPILVTRRGRLAGVFFPWPEGTLPMELKREAFSVLSDQIRRQVKKRGLSEEEIVADFALWRKSRRETRRRRKRAPLGRAGRSRQVGAGTSRDDRDSRN